MNTGQVWGQNAPVFSRPDLRRLTVGRLVRRGIEIEGSTRNFSWPLGVVESLGGGEMSSTVIILLLVWVGLNAGFVAIRLYAGADRRLHGKPDLVRFPRLLN